MRVTIIPDDKTVIVDGEGIHGIDMTGVDPDIHAIQFYGDHGWVEWKTPGKMPSKIVSIEAYRKQLDEHADVLDLIRGREADPYHRVSKEEAYQIKKAEIEAYFATKSTEPVDVDGDEIAPDPAFMLATLHRLRNAPRATPIRWKVRNKTTGKPAKKQFTKAKFEAAIDQVYDKVSADWDRKEALLDQLEILLADKGKTAQHIKALQVE